MQPEGVESSRATHAAAPAVGGDLLPVFLAERDVSCPGCGYNLRGLRVHRCPECNQDLVLEVRLADPKLGAFLFGVVGVGMALGFCVLVIVWGLIMSAPRSDLIPLAVGTPIGAIVLLRWLRERRRIQTMDDSTRWRRAILMTVIAFACPVWFMLTVR